MTSISCLRSQTWQELLPSWCLGCILWPSLEGVLTQHSYMCLDCLLKGRVTSDPIRSVFACGGSNLHARAPQLDRSRCQFSPFVMDSPRRFEWAMIENISDKALTADVLQDPLSWEELSP